MASSAQCASSITATVKWAGGPSSARKPVNNRSRGAPLWHRAAKSPPSCALMSNSGPSGRGVSRPSQPPHSQRAPGRRCWNASSSTVLPMPDSPDTRTSRPSPRRASAAYSASVARNGVRSRSSMAGPAPLVPCYWILASPQERGNPARPRRAPAAACGARRGLPASARPRTTSHRRRPSLAGRAYRMLQRKLSKDSFACMAETRRAIRQANDRPPGAARAGAPAAAVPARTAAHGGAADRHPGRRAARRELRELLLPPAAAGQVRPGRGGGRRPRPGAPLAGHGHAHRRACGRRQPGAGRRVRPVPVDRRRALLRGDDELAGGQAGRA